MRGSQQRVVRAVFLLALVVNSVAGISSSHLGLAAVERQADEQPAQPHQSGTFLIASDGREQLATSASQLDLNLRVSQPANLFVCTFAAESARHTHADCPFLHHI